MNPFLGATLPVGGEGGVKGRTQSQLKIVITSKVLYNNYLQRFSSRYAKLKQGALWPI